MSRPSSKDSRFISPQRILVRAPNWIGDQVLAFPFFHYLRRAFPNSKITSACVPWVADVQYRGLVDDVFVLEKAARPGFWAKWKNLNENARRARALGPWDLAISLPNSFSAAWFMRAAGAQRRRGYAFEGRGFLLNDPLKLADEALDIEHRAKSYLRLLPEQARPSGSPHAFWGVYPEDALDEKIPGELDRFDFERYWPAERIAPPAKPYWVLAPGATADSRRWPVEYFIQLAREIADATDLVGVVVGGPKEAPVAERLCAIDGLRLEDYTARGPVPALAGIFRGARFTVTNESGLAHVASLCGSFTHIVCGAADPRRTKPLGPGPVQVSVNAVECWPCERNACFQPIEKQIQCLKGIKPARVFEEIRNGLRKVDSRSSPGN